MSEIWQKYVTRPVVGFTPMFGKPNGRASRGHQMKVVFQRKDGFQALGTLPQVSQAAFASDKKRQEAIDKLREMQPEIPEGASVIDCYLQTPIGWYRVKEGKLQFKPFPPA